MPTLDKAIRRIDQPPAKSGGAASPLGGAVAAAPPSLPTVAAPTELAVASTAIYRSAVTPSALANLTWRPPTNVVLEGHLVQWDDDPAFGSPVTREVGVSGMAGIEGLPAGVSVSFRVAAIAKGGIQSPWSTTVAATMPSDSTAPLAPTNLAYLWSGTSGDLLLTWSDSPSANLRHYQVRILTADGTVELVNDLSASPSYTFTREQHRVARSGAFVASVQVQVSAVSWSGIESAAVTTVAALARPGNPVAAAVSVAINGATGAMLFRWNLAGEIAGVRLTLDGVARDLPPVAEYLYTREQNQVDHGGTAPDPSIAWSLAYVDALEQTSAVPATGTATQPRPATPASVTTTWSNDDGTAAADLLLTWLQAVGVAGYRLAIDAVTRDLPVGDRALYAFGQNRAEHGGTASPSLTWSLVAVDAFGQVSATPASGTAVNTAPPATAIVLRATFNVLTFDATPSAARDLSHYRVRLYRGATAVATLTPTDPFGTVDVSSYGAGSYSADVAAVDLFGQIGPVATSPTVQMDTLTLAELRAALTYRDDLSNTQPTLAALKDAVDDAGGVTYS